MKKRVVLINGWYCLPLKEWEKHHRNTYPRADYIGDIEDLHENATFLKRKYGAHVSEIESFAKKHLRLDSLKGVKFFREDNFLLKDPVTGVLKEFDRDSLIFYATVLFEDLRKNQGDVRLWWKKNKNLSPHFWERFVYISEDG